MTLGFACNLQFGTATCRRRRSPLRLRAVDPAGYNIRQQAQRSTNSLKTKNQDTNGESYAEDKNALLARHSPRF